jgi:hypothetical protein
VKRVAILLHQHERPLDASDFTIEILRREWARDGRAVEVVTGTTRSPDAELVVNHVDLTVTPAPYRQLLARYPRAINDQLVDISKSRISPNLVTRDSDHRGMVIVKSNANAGGARDLMLGAKTSFAGRVRWKRARMNRSRHADDPSAARYFARGEYPIYDSPADVPTGVWKNPALVVEKFQTERDANGHFVLRAWSFLGDAEFTVRTVSPEPVAKGARLIERAVQPAGPPEEVRAFRAAFHADYGRIDYAIVDGTAVVYDLNRTPTTTPTARETYRDELTRLACGIAAF